MATFGEYWSIPGLKASSSLASYQYYVVKASSTAGEVKLADAANAVSLGVLQNDPGAGEACDVAFAGLAKVYCEASTTYGCALAASTTGRAKVTTAEGACVIGYALEAYSTAGGLIRVMLSRSIGAGAS